MIDPSRGSEKNNLDFGNNFFHSTVDSVRGEMYSKRCLIANLLLRRLAQLLAPQRHKPLPPPLPSPSDGSPKLCRTLPLSANAKAPPQTEELAEMSAPKLQASCAHPPEPPGRALHGNVMVENIGARTKNHKAEHVRRSPLNDEIVV